MGPYLSDPDFTLYVGDVRDVLPKLPADSVDCVATSPPFYGLRDYGTGAWEGGDPGCDHVVRLGDGGSGEEPAEDYPRPFRTGKQYTHQQVTGPVCRCGAQRTDRQIGLEATPDQWALELVRVFRECRRVLKPSGTLWIECGDSYGSANGKHRGDGPWVDGGSPHTSASTATAGIKPKDLLGAPWLLAFALRADGWYLRQCLIWHKPNCMPESAKDRCTTAHSYVFLLSKKPRYWFDSDAIAEPAAWERWGDQTTPKYEGTQTATGWMQPRQIIKSKAPDGWDTSAGAGGHGSVHRDGRAKGKDAYVASGSKNARSVWTIPTQGYPEAHFATWPEALAERIVKAGCPEWVCGVCGAPRTRISEPVAEFVRASGDNGPHHRPAPVREGSDARIDAMAAGGFVAGRSTIRETVGWSDCGHNAYKPGTILDPFMGAGTTALVARRLSRHSVGVELNEEYAAMCARRLGQQSLLS